MAPRSAPSWSNGVGPRLQLSACSGPGESSTALLALQSAAVPELPDLAVVAEAFHAALAGRPITSVEAPGPLAVRGTPAELEALVGQRRRSASGAAASSCSLDLDRDRVVVQPDAHRPLPAGGARRRRCRRRPPSCSGSARAPGAPARCSAPGLPARPGCRPTTPRPRSAIATRPRWARSTSLPAGVDRDVPGLATRSSGPTPTIRR